MRNFFKFTFIFVTTIWAKAQVPTATILGVSPVICSDANTFFAAKVTRLPGTVISYKWTLPANRSAVVVSRDNDSTVVCKFGLPGIYTLSLSVSDGTTTSGTTQLLSVTRSARASFNASLTSVGFPNQLSLTNYSSYHLKSYWLYSGNSQKDSSDFVLKDYPSSGDYTVTLVSTGKNGCNDSLAYAFRIAAVSAVSLPNIFSPNDDGVNDIYQPITQGVSKLKAWIYNRYGNLVASWERVDGTWDGRTTSGLECGMGEYYIFVEASGFDGVNYKQKSNISLVR